MIDGKEPHDDKQPYCSYRYFVPSIDFSLSLFITTGVLRLVVAVVVVVSGGDGAESTTIGR